MKKFYKKVLSLLLVAGILFSLCAFPAYASDVAYSEGPDMPLGALTEEELLHLVEATSGYCSECPTPRHSAFSAHRHEVLNITASYQRLVSAGEDLSGLVLDCMHGDGQRVLTFSEEIAVANSWSASIDFSGDVVSASLGFSVEFSGSATAGFELDVPDQYAGQIYCWKRYQVKEFNLQTTWYNPYSSTPYIEYGTGSAEQWLRFTYNSKLIPPEPVEA